ncbi:hypothetical protein B0H14DRAFT_3539616 [Mycena olivaceomarginata]|nr:hypothetical protein B0H14DRAFT_3539616 [Mycena olivaceomarginata]
MHLKAPFVDSSNRTFFTNPKLKRHTHLRSSSTSSIQKSPRTCTVSLASITAYLTVSLDLPAMINFLLSAPRSSCVPFPTDADASGEDPSPVPEAWRGPRARTLSLEPPRRTYPPKSRVRVSIPSKRLLAPHGRHLRASSPTRTSTGIVPPACAPSVLSWSR